MKPSILRKPDWIKIRLAKGGSFDSVRDTIQHKGLNTICSSGMCPNAPECWSNGTATFMILGNICTRSCKFCNVKNGKPLPVDYNEPLKVAEAVNAMGLKHCVITSVDRDDLADGGASVWARVVKEIKNMNPGITIETLVPDFKGNLKDLDKVIESAPDIISHNLETTRRLTPQIRSRATYDVSLNVLRHIAESGIKAKSGIMVGLGESEEEVYETMDDLLLFNCKIMTIGQYLQPTLKHTPVVEYISPAQFEKYRLTGIQKGFDFIESAPLVRSSYHAEKQIKCQ